MDGLPTPLGLRHTQILIYVIAINLYGGNIRNPNPNARWSESIHLS
jgi:hypothetical protein